MSIITNLPLNKEVSFEFAQKWDYIVQLNKCYANIYEIVQEWSLDRDFEIGYCYYGIPSINMIRHCVLVYNKEFIVDPTVAPKGFLEKSEYHLFKLFTQNDYDNFFYDFFESNPEGEIYNDLKGMIPEEIDYCKYAVDNKVKIDKYSYRYLEDYDINKEITVTDYIK